MRSPKARPHRPPRAGVAAWVALAAIGLAACGPAQRPAGAEWRAVWDDVRDAVPPAADLPRPPSHQACQEVLADLREQRQRLFPAPDAVVAAAAESWIEHAESLFFGCFDTDNPDAAMALGYATLQRLGGEVDAALGRRTPTPRG